MSEHVGIQDRLTPVERGGWTAGARRKEWNDGPVWACPFCRDMGTRFGDRAAHEKDEQHQQRYDERGRSPEHAEVGERGCLLLLAHLLKRPQGHLPGGHLPGKAVSP